MDNTVLKNFVNMYELKQQLESEVEEVKEALKGLEQAVLKEFETSGVDKLRIDGRTIFLHRQLWAGPKKAGEYATDAEYAVACAALKDSGLGDFVHERFNTNSISAWVREQEKNGAALPVAVANTLNVEEKFSVRTRKGG